jgi:hypothetical protein
MDNAGNLCGTTQGNPGAGDYGTVFALTPSGGGWTYTLLYRFTGGSDGANPYSTLVFDASGNLYGTTKAGGANGYVVVLELTLGPMVTLNPPSLNFGSVPIYGKKLKSTTLTNSGNATLHITDITITGDTRDFSQTNNCPDPGSLGAEDYCTITVTFLPESYGNHSADVSITDDAPGSPQQVPLSGYAFNPCRGVCGRCTYGCICDPLSGGCVPQLGDEASKSQQCGSEPAFPLGEQNLEWTRK